MFCRKEEVSGLRTKVPGLINLFYMTIGRRGIAFPLFIVIVTTLLSTFFPEPEEAADSFFVFAQEAEEERVNGVGMMIITYHQKHSFVL